jgi:hypothetical protein
MVKTSCWLLMPPEVSATAADQLHEVLGHHAPRPRRVQLRQNALMFFLIHLIGD